MAAKKNTRQEVNEVDELAKKAEVASHTLMQKMDFEPGVHYRGSLWVNEYGEMNFRAEQKGTNPCGLKKLTDGDNWVIYTSKNLVRIVVSLPRLDSREIRKMFSSAVTNVLAHLIRYDLKK